MSAVSLPSFFSLILNLTAPLMPELLPFPSSFGFPVSVTELLQSVLDTSPVVEIQLLPYARQPVYMVLCLQQEAKRGQRGHPCLFLCILC